MSFSNLVREERRSALLCFLMESTAYRMRLSVLGEALETTGIGAAFDVVLGDAAWLEEQGLVVISDLKGIIVAELTQRGVDVAMGLARCPGVKRPSPEQYGKIRHSNGELAELSSELHSIRVAIERIGERLSQMMAQKSAKDSL